MTVKRYDAMHKDVWTDESGKYVKYEEYAALKAKMDMVRGLMNAAEQANALAKESVESLLAERDALKEQVVNLAVENSALKEYRPQPVGSAMFEAIHAAGGVVEGSE